MFGLGMNNNGTGLVMASLALADHPRVLLPIIVYNLVQHLVAGAADRIIRTREAVRAGSSGWQPRLRRPGSWARGDSPRQAGG